MKVAVICRSDGTGGAAIVSRRLTEALRSFGIDATMLVESRTTALPYVEKTSRPLLEEWAFAAERLQIFLNNGMRRDTLFKVDTGSYGLPLWKHPVVKEADAVILNWVNQGMLSLQGVEKIAAGGKKVVWTMHDMWNFTGICHHSLGCTRYRESCGDCPFLGSKSSPQDLSARIWRNKKNLYGSVNIKFVAVSSWLRNLALQSSLLGNQELHLIPNPFPLNDLPERKSDSKTKRILFAAARLDDPIKGLPLLKEGISRFAAKYPEEAAAAELIFAGRAKNEEQLEGFSIPTKRLGMLTGEHNLRKAFGKADIVISTSLFENLPGTLVEGQAYGAIPVSFDRGGQRDIIGHLSTGYLVPWSENYEARSEGIADGLHWALNQNDTIRERMRKNVEERFSYEAVADEYVKILDR